MIAIGGSGVEMRVTGIDDIEFETEEL